MGSPSSPYKSRGLWSRAQPKRVKIINPPAPYNYKTKNTGGHLFFFTSVSHRISKAYSACKFCSRKRIDVENDFVCPKRPKKI